MTVRNYLLLAVAGLLPFTSCTLNAAEFYVSPAGSSDNPGTKDQPFLKFSDAVEAVSKLIERNAGNQEFRVYFREGSYRFEETAVIAGEKFTRGNKIVFSAYRDEKVVFSAGRKIPAWTKETADIPSLPEKARGKIWSADVPRTKQRAVARSLCDDSGPLPNAVSPGLFTAEDDTVSRLKDDFDLPASELSFFVFPEGAFRKWANLQDIEVVTIPHYGFTMNILPLESVDMERRIARTAIPGTYKLCRLRSYNRPNLWVQNAIDFLDEPGEWVIDSSAMKIYHWPRSEAPGDIYYPTLHEIIRVEGNPEAGEIVKSIEFNGITFAHGDRPTWGRNTRGLQHDWALYDESDALLRFVGTENCAVVDCSFTNSGGGGVRFDFHSRNNKVLNCRFSRLGGTAILLCGYGPGGKDVNRNNVVERNEIHDCGQLFWHSPAIFVWQSGGNRIANNLIYNTPYSGIVVSGPRSYFFDPQTLPRREQMGTMNFGRMKDLPVEQDDWDAFYPHYKKYLFATENTVEYNELHHIALELEDANGIYLSGHGPGNVVRGNFLHHNTRSTLHGIIRADDQSNDVTITENIVYKFTGAGIRFKHSCYVTNNYLIDWMPAEDSSDRRKFVNHFLNVSPLGSISGSIIRNNICYQSRGLAQPFFGMRPPASLRTEVSVRDIDLDRNLYYAADHARESEKQLAEWQEEGVEPNSRAADPLFEGLEEAGFRLKDDSPAHRLGIKQIDFARIGLRR